MRDALLECVCEQPNIEILCDHDFTALIEDDSGVRLQFANPKQQSVKGDFVIAADGVGSKVRQVLDLPQALVSNTTNFRGSLDVPLPTNDDNQNNCTAAMASAELIALLDKGIVPLAIQKGGDMYFVLFNFHSKKPGRLAWILATQRDIPDPTATTLADPESVVTPITIARDCVEDPDKLRLLEEIFAFSADHHMIPYPKSSIVDLSDQVLTATFSDGGWGGKGRVTFIGDAAHGMRPTDGYGGSMAFEDAVVLASTLRQGLDENNLERQNTKDESSSKLDITALLKEYERKRRQRVKIVYDNQFERYRQRMEGGRPPAPQDEEFTDWLFNGI